MDLCQIFIKKRNLKVNLNWFEIHQLNGLTLPRIIKIIYFNSNRFLSCKQTACNEITSVKQNTSTYTFHSFDPQLLTLFYEAKCSHPGSFRNSTHIRFLLSEEHQAPCFWNGHHLLLREQGKIHMNQWGTKGSTKVAVNPITNCQFV